MNQCTDFDTDTSIRVAYGVFNDNREQRQQPTHTGYCALECMTIFWCHRKGVMSTMDERRDSISGYRWLHGAHATLWRFRIFAKETNWRARVVAQYKNFFVLATNCSNVEFPSNYYHRNELCSIPPHMSSLWVHNNNVNWKNNAHNTNRSGSTIARHTIVNISYCNNTLSLTIRIMNECW